MIAALHQEQLIVYSDHTSCFLLTFRKLTRTFEPPLGKDLKKACKTCL